MTNDKLDNPLAFPLPSQYVIPGRGAIDNSQPGMTLRDYFAAKAMQSIITFGRDDIFNETNWAAAVAASAYKHADAMLKEREARK